MKALSIENLSFKYGRKKQNIFEEFNLSFNKGGIYGLLGKNGAGKSTLIYLMDGLLTPSQGEVTFNGINVRKRMPETLNDIYIVPEEYDLPNIHLRKYVKLNAPFYPKFNEDDMNRYLELFEMSTDINLQDLSMGQKKKVLLSFALATHTSVLLMDEPTNGLDIPGKSQFRKFIASGIDEEQIVIISTHQVRDVEQLLDHIVILDRSKVLLNESTEHICEVLRFEETDDESLTKDALYSAPSPQENLVMLPNDEEAETRLNIEMLFNGILANTENISRLFENNKETTSK